MSYYVKVGDENTQVPESCDKCYLCQNKFALCENCSLLDNYNDGNFSLWDLVPKKEYRCAANLNQIIQDISKKPEWCPIQYVKNNLIYTEFDKKLDQEFEGFIPRNGESE